MAAVWAFFSKNGTFFQFSRKDTGDLPLLHSSDTPVVVRACKILLLTKLTIMKVKTDVLSVSTISL